MKILITGNALDNFSGQPVSTYEMARVLSRDHDVTVCVLPNRIGDNEMTRRLENLGVKLTSIAESKYDLILASEWCPHNVKAPRRINIVRSEYWDETPLKDFDHYICIRPSIQKHIIEEHGIKKKDTSVIYNGVDRTRFRQIEKSERDHIKVVAPCNIDTLREKWLNYMVSITEEGRQLYIYGKQGKGNVKLNKWCHLNPPTFEMEKVIADADVVVGILLGRVNLEANSCRVPSICFDPDTLLATPFLLDEEEFNERHNIENVVKKILKC